LSALKRADAHASTMLNTAVNCKTGARLAVLWFGVGPAAD
jgi:hypothetical protein